MWVSPKTIKNVAPQWTIVPSVASGTADDQRPTGLGCSSCLMDFSSACSVQERGAKPEEKGMGEGDRVRLCVLWGPKRHMAQETSELGVQEAGYLFSYLPVPTCA